jgi:nucleoside-diphosphate-sugar epimerase
MSPGGQYLDLVHIDDVIDAFVRAGQEILALPQAGTRTYSVTSGEPHTLREVIGIFEEVLGRKLDIEFGGLPYRDREPMMPWMPGAPTVPGWSPSYDLKRGLKEMLAAEGLL